MRKKILLYLCVFLMVLGLGYFAGCAAPVTDSSENEKTKPNNDIETIELSFASFMPAGGNFEGQVTATFVDEIDKATDGRVKVITYPGGSLLKGGEIYNGVVEGAVDIGFDCITWIMGRFPVSFMFEQPGVSFNNAKVASSVFNDAMRTLNPEEFHDIKPLMFFCTGPGHIMSTVPIRKLDDLKGFEIRATSAMEPAFSAVGAVTTTLVQADVYEALQKGVIKAHISPIETLKSWNFADIVDYVIMTPFLYNANFVIAMNKDVYNSLPEDIQNAIDQVSEKVWKECVLPFFDKENEMGLNYAKEKSGFEVIYLPEEDIEKWKKEIAFIIDDYAKNLDSKGLPGTQAKNLLFELAEKYNSIYQ